MCLAPIEVNGFTVPCGGCWQCESAKTWDWVGRMVAERNASDHARFMTLTYAGDTPHTVVFAKSHVQKMIRDLRRAGRPRKRQPGRKSWTVRYMVVGELGTANQRVHWHAILFFRGDVPDMEMTTHGAGHMFDWSFWPHGATVAKEADEKNMRYIAKYIFKDPDRNNPGYHNTPPIMSKKPPLGDDMVTKFASDLVDAGLPFNNPEYQFDGIIERKKRAHRKFWFQGVSRENVMQRYHDLWRAKYGTEPPWSEYFVEKHLDRIARAEMAMDTGNLERDLDAKRPNISVRQMRDEDFSAAGADPFNADRRKSAMLVIRRGDDMGTVDLFTDGTATVAIGDESECLLSRADGSFDHLCAQLQAAGLHRRNVRRVSRWLAGKWQITVPGDALPR